jgi:hypothetical protein
MKLEELEKTLPNGLHDSKVSRIVVDYQQRKLTLDLDVWTGDMTNDRPELREAYKRGHPNFGPAFRGDGTTRSEISVLEFRSTDHRRLRYEQESFG